MNEGGEDGMQGDDDGAQGGNKEEQGRQEEEERGEREGGDRTFSGLVPSTRKSLIRRSTRRLLSLSRESNSGCS